MAEIKPFITKGNNLDNKFRYANKKIVAEPNEDEKRFRQRIENDTYHFILANPKEEIVKVKDFDKDGNKRVLIYVKVI